MGLSGYQKDKMIFIWSNKKIMLSQKYIFLMNSTQIKTDLNGLALIFKLNNYFRDSLFSLM